MTKAGIQEVEYQLMVIPDSAHLLPFVGLGSPDMGQLRSCLVGEKNLGDIH